MEGVFLIFLKGILNYLFSKHIRVYMDLVHAAIKYTIILNIKTTYGEFTKRYNKNKICINLSEMLITELPPEIGMFPDLLYLNLSFNSLTILPPEIGLQCFSGALTKLKILNLSHNSLKLIPREIGLLVNLVELDLYWQ